MAEPVRPLPPEEAPKDEHGRQPVPNIGEFTKLPEQGRATPSPSAAPSAPDQNQHRLADRLSETEPSQIPAPRPGQAVSEPEQETAPPLPESQSDPARSAEDSTETAGRGITRPRQNRLEERRKDLDRHRVATREAERSHSIAARSALRKGLIGGCAALLAEIPVLVIVLLVIASAALVGLQGVGGPETAQASSGGPFGVCGVDVGQPGGDGYVLLPEDPAYDLNVNGGSPRGEQRGLPELVQTIVAVTRQWNINHPDQRVGIGDLNAPGHASHKEGIDVDIYSRAGLFPSFPGHAKNSRYNPALAEEYAKLFFQVGNLDLIGFTDQRVIDNVNAWAKSQGLAGEMQNWSGHDDHFHIRIQKSSSLKDICSATSQAQIDPGTYEELANKVLSHPKISFQNSSCAPPDIKAQRVNINLLRAVLAIANAGYKQAISVMISCHRPGSDHEIGLAVDTGSAGTPDLPGIARFVYQNRAALKIKDLFGPDQRWWLDEGKPWLTNHDSGLVADHKDHNHISVFPQ